MAGAGRKATAVQRPQGRLDLSLFGECPGILYLDSKLANGAFEHPVTEQQLYSPWILGSLVDESCLVVS